MVAIDRAKKSPSNDGSPLSAGSSNFDPMEGSAASDSATSVIQKKPQFVDFSPDCLDFIHSSVEEKKKNKFTKVGRKKNMVFKLMGNENKLIKTILHGHGFTQGSPDNRLFNVAWTSSFISGHKMKNLRPWQRINMFPRLKQLTFKDQLYMNVGRSWLLFGDVYGFIPDSFILPRDRDKMREVMPRNEASAGRPVQYIVKPVASCEGKGIFFVTNAEEVPEKRKLLVSRYIERPLLVNGHKFDLRIYVAVTSFYPLVIHMYSEGLTRFASAKYSEVIGEEAPYVHLTNYSLNKKSENYVRNESLDTEDHGHKWTLGALLRHLEKEGHDTKLLMIRIEDVVIKTLLSVQSAIASVTRNTLLHVGTNFRLFGFDILIDEEMKPWLLEVNLNPSLASEAPLDVLLKPQLVSDLLNLVCIPRVNPATMPAPVEEKIKGSYRKYSLKRKADGSQVTRFLTDGAIDRRVQGWLERLRNEEGRAGSFIRIFPRENSYKLYKGVMEDCGPEKYDQQVYEGLFGKMTLSNEISDLYHTVMMNPSHFSSFKKCPQPIKKLISSWYRGTTSQYIEKITEEGMSYRAKLPVVRSTARLRTESYSSYLKKKKQDEGADQASAASSTESMDKENKQQQEQPPILAKKSLTDAFQPQLPLVSAPL